MQLAFNHATTPGSVDATLNMLVGHWAGEGRRIVRVIQEPSGDDDRHRCDMDLIEISSGARLPISQDLGTDCSGCRLDPNAIEIAARRVVDALDHAPADLMVINRFGKLEAMGRGFCAVISQALEKGAPVLIGVNDLNRPAFEELPGGLVIELPDEAAAVLGWALPLMRKTAT